MARSARFSALFGRDLHLLAFTLRLLALALLGLLANSAYGAPLVEAVGVCRRCVVHLLRIAFTHVARALAGSAAATYVPPPLVSDAYDLVLIHRTIHHHVQGALAADEQRWIRWRR